MIPLCMAVIVNCHDDASVLSMKISRPKTKESAM